MTSPVAAPPHPPRARPQARNKWVTRRQKLCLVIGSLGVCAVSLLLGEAFCRTFTDVNVQGNSRELFADHVFGDSMGHAQNARGSSFGADVWIDENGFRDFSASTK